MLPSLSSTWGAKVEVLAPTVIEPAGVSARRHALLELKKVVAVRVLDRTGRSGNTPYVLDTATSAQSNSTVCTTADPSGSITSSSRSEGTARSTQSAHKSSFQTERKLEEFTELRSNVYYSAHTAHSREPCAFCAEVTQYVIVVAPKPDSMTLRLLGEERAKRKLTQFVTGLLELVVDHLSADVRGACAGQVRIPQLLYEFLFTASAEACEAA